MKKYEPRHKKDNSRRTALRKKRLKNGRIFVPREDVKTFNIKVIKIGLFRRIINFIKRICAID